MTGWNVCLSSMTMNCGKDFSGAKDIHPFWTAYKEAYTNSLAEAEKNNMEAFDEVFFPAGVALYVFGKSQPGRFVHYAVPWLSFAANAFSIA
jgi:hypothetical protein